MPKVVSDAENRKKKIQRELDEAKGKMNIGKAGSSAPAFANANSFAEYSAMRKAQEEDAANKGAANLLAKRYALPGSYGSREYQEDKMNNIGYKRVGNQAVFVTPNSPLPRLTKENTATKAQAPGAFGIAPEDYLKHMGAIDRQNSIRQPEAPDEETTAFLNKYFGGKLPNADEFNERYDELLNDYSVPDEEVRYFYNEGAELVGKATQERERYDQEMSENSAAYEEAIAALGKDAIQHAGGTEADYFERFDNTYGAEKPAEENYLTYGGADGMSLEEAKKYSASPYIERGQGYDLQRWSQTLPEERERYNHLLANYGQDVADMYMQSLESDLNKRLADAETLRAQSYADQHPILANLETVAKAPIRGAGVLERYVEELFTGKQPDEYDPRLNLIRESEAIRGETAQNIKENTSGIWSKVLPFAYQTGMSMTDNLANMAMWGGLGNWATLLNMGLSSAGSAYNSAIDRGANHETANAAGLISGIAEGFFEKFSLENVISMAKGGGMKNAVLNVIKQMGIEGSEELATAVANEITDRAVMGELSQFELNKQRFMNDGMTEAEAQAAAYAETAKEIGLSMAAGALSGGVMGAGGQAIAAYGRRAEQKANMPKSKEEAKAEIQEEGKAKPAPEQPVNQEQPDEQAEAAQLWEQDQLQQETHEERTQAEETHEEHTQPAQAAQLQPSTQEDKQQQGQEKKPANAPKTVKKTMRFKVPVKASQYDEDGNAHSMNVVGVREVNDGRVLLEVETENGSIEVQRAEDVDFDDDGTTTMLLDYGPTERMDAAAVRNYLENYDPTRATEEEYAKVYSAVYARGAAGVDYDTAVEGIGNALTQEAAYLAYAAGENVYNQKNDTVQAAEVVQEPAAEEPKGAKLSAKEPLAKGLLSKRYSQRAFDALGMDGKRRANAQMEILTALASRTKRTIHVVDTIIAEDGTHANASYDPKTGVIRVALDADESAYAYAAAHELTHALKNEHKGEWKAFRDFVTEALETNGKSVEALVQEQMDRHGYNREDAMEEVICNAVPAILQDETNLFKLYKGNRTLFERVMNWVKNLVDDVKRVGEALSKRSPSWKQMDALAKDRKSLQTIYDMMMSVMERGAEDVSDNNVVKMSAKEKDYYDYSKPLDSVSKVNSQKLEQTDTKEFKRWFGKSQVVNADGSPKVMYRGGGEEINIFDRKKSKYSNLYGRGFYFTDSETHAKQYGEVRSYYLRIESPLNAGSGEKKITPKQMRAFLEEVAENEDYGLENFGYDATVDSVLKSLKGKNDFDALQDINATAIGDFVAAIELFNEVNGTNYDGIITPTETVVFDSRQIKSATDNVGTFDANNQDIRFSLKEPVEETRDLLAVHNLTEDNLRSALELGGLAMPSIAVIKAEQGHSKYGPISAVFDKTTIDPKASSANEIYGGDAWTPTFPRVEYEANSKTEKRIRDKYYELEHKVGNQTARALYRYATDLEEEMNRHGGVSEILKKLEGSTDMMQMYLVDNGWEVPEPVKKTIVKRTPKLQAEQYDSLIQKMGEDVVRSFEAPEGKKVGDHRRAWMDEHYEALKQAYVEVMADATGLPEENVAALADNKQNVRSMLMNAYNYMKTGGETREEVIDYEATEKAIRDEVDKKAYKKWLNDLFEGAEKNKGIRNQTDLFTPSGNRRSFSATHWAVTLENAVKAMRAEEKIGVGTLGRNIEGAAVKKYQSIKDVKADSERLRTIPEEEYEMMRQSFREHFQALALEYAMDEDEVHGDWIYAADRLVEYVTQTQTADGIYKLMQKDAKFYKPSRYVAEELAELVEEMKNAPTGYFEAKPRRAIGFDEVAAMVVPDNLSDDVRTAIENAGVTMIEYEAGNEEDRLAKMNGEEVGKLKFSLRDTDENVQNALTAQQAAFQQIQGGHHITALEADKIATTMLKSANSDYDQKQLAGELSRIFHYIETSGDDVDWQQVDDEMTDLSSRVMARSRTIDIEHEQEAKPVRDYLRTHAFSLTKDQKDEAAKISGTYGAYRKALFGRVRLSNTAGSSLEHIWRDLHDMAPQWFDADTKAGDMPRALMDAVDAMKTVYHNESGMNAEESAQWLASVMTDAYFQLPAVKAAARDARKFGDSIRDLHKAWQSFKDTSWSGYQNALEAIKAARGKQQRTEQQERVAAMRKKYEKWRESDNAMRREREKKAKYRTRIENTVNTLLNWLDKPTDAKHIPADVEGYVRNLLSALDFTGKDTKTAQALSQRLDMLATALQQAQEGEDENRTVFLERDQQMIDEIRHMAQVIGGNQQEGRGVYDLNGLELQELSKWLDVVKHVITEANKMHGGNISVDEAATASIMELDRKKDYKDKTEMQKRLDKNFGPDMQDSFTFFGRLGATANYVFTELRKGFDKSVQLTRKAEEHTKAVLEGLNLKEISGRKAQKQTFELASGEKLELTKGQIMELYVLDRREQARGHLYGDGIILRESEDKIPKKLMQGDVLAITKTLTEEERKAAEMLQRFLSKECAAWGNEASLTLLGYRKFGEEYYWPISTDSNARNTTKLEDTYAADIGAIKNQGMTKQTIEGAKNAIVVGDIFDTYTRHISNMVAYASYAVPLSDFTRWYNSRGVKTQIEQKLGKGALNYINEFLMAINGSSRQAKASGIAGTIKWMNRNAKAASVGLNLRVVVQQPTSFARAAMYMSPKHLSKALGMKSPSMELVNKYCGIAQWKSWGFYETNIGPNLRAMLTGDKTVLENWREKSMWLAAKGDEWTLKHLWNACEAETRELWPELQPGSEEYYQQVGQRMSEVVDRTQVVDSVFHRSQMMRSKNELNQMLTNFMSEPTKTYNMLMDAYYQYAENRKDKAAREKLGRAILTYAISGVLTAAAAAVMDAFRDEDAEKEWIEKYLSAFEENTADNLNPFGMLPGVKDVISLLEGYEASRLDQQSLQKVVWAVNEVQKYVQGESKQNWWGVSYKVMNAASSLTGIPASNLMREGNAIYQTVTGTSATKTAEAQKNSTISQLYKATMEGKIKRANDLRTRLQKQAGMTPKEIDTKLAEELKAHPKVKEAYEAKKAGRIADANRARNALTAMGFSGETVDKAISRYEASITPKEEKQKDANEQLSVKLYTSKDAASVIRMACGLEKGASSLADAKAVISELIADSTAKDAAKTTKSNIQSELKADYVKLVQSGKTAQAKRLAQMMQELLGTTQKTLDKWIKDAETK